MLRRHVCIALATLCSKVDADARRGKPFFDRASPGPESITAAHLVKSRSAAVCSQISMIGRAATRHRQPHGHDTRAAAATREQRENSAHQSITQNVDCNRFWAWTSRWGGGTRNGDASTRQCPG